MVTATTKRFGPSLPNAFVMVLCAPLFGIVQGWTGFAVWAVVGTVVGFLRQRRFRLELTQSGARAGWLWRSRFVGWDDVLGVEPSSTLSAGLRLRTSAGVVRSPVPNSWWGGPATPEQVAEVERWWVDHRGAGAEPTI